MAEYTPCEIKLSNTEAANLLISLYSDYKSLTGESIPYLNAVTAAILALNFVNFNYLSIKTAPEIDLEQLKQTLQQSNFPIIPV